MGKMIVMPANNTGVHAGYLAGRFPGRIGHLYSPGAFRGPYDFIPYALDNARFTTWIKGSTWDEVAFLKHLDKAADSQQKPLWTLVPDVVADRDQTLREWDKWAPKLQGYAFELAFAAQDGMTFDDVPKEASVVFLGGTTEWKLKNIRPWCAHFPKVHVGRVNGAKGLWLCHRAGAKSCDGTGWYRGDKKQLAALVRYLERSSLGLEFSDQKTINFVGA